MITAIRVPAAVLTVSLLLAGCQSGGGAAQTRAAVAADGAEGTPAPASSPAATPDAPEELPGLGPRTRAGIPSNARQVVVVTGKDRNSSDSAVVLYERTDSGWKAGRQWPAHNALKGWTDHHMSGDLRSPIGVYALTDAGGRLPDPGTRLPYDHSHGFTALGTGFEGESLAGAFDYVVAINYNRKPGTSPRDWTRPLGGRRGGGIWFHVDHGGPTHGCVTLEEADMKALLRALDPDRHPVVVMGDATSLAR
ncbi:L,D-transpeptidase family protein [Streptomyces cynarae]|uniref:L,D-transpeptidase family protein n=1 Tax=Streptomyces cynarae TaxID=2981134 RepID=A0ABY6DWE1_9ACTN|nr:L,D-transpeptidase family protein [Streptomyces cynarae]UXY18023.1 L,D-transpeptidase family protein [Streptomyces cynarae]